MSKNEQMVGISRRTLVKSTAIGSLALAAGGFSLPFNMAMRLYIFSTLQGSLAAI
ncbi:TPA: hypothetical protein SI662_001323 [Escherichia coli]|nr:hypothetical protein [Escherichia coli]EHU6053377.1 hypothetical protein [Escherichia coli]EIA0336312.1 hypothetical protein [Escherichia coli]EIH8517295.1 hypothetical protein [Escherichia coli]EIQ0322484.1 hypothetical protein [Escherichia coli]